MAITGLSKVRFDKKTWPKSQGRSYLLGLLYCSCGKTAILYARICIWQRSDEFSGGDLWWCKKTCFKSERSYCFLPSSVSRQACPEKPVHSIWTDYMFCFFRTHVRSSSLGKAKDMNRANTELQFLALKQKTLRCFLSTISFCSWLGSCLGFFCCWFWWISFHISNPFWNPFISLASTASCGNEFYNLIMQCVKKHFPLFAENFLDDNFV